MGNQSSSEGGGRTFGRSGNSLGLSRSELEKRCRPSGWVDRGSWHLTPKNIVVTSRKWFWTNHLAPFPWETNQKPQNQTELGNEAIDIGRLLKMMMMALCVFECCCDSGTNFLVSSACLLDFPAVFFHPSYIQFKQKVCTIIASGMTRRFANWSEMVNWRQDRKDVKIEPRIAIKSAPFASCTTRKPMSPSAVEPIFVRNVICKWNPKRTRWPVVPFAIPPKSAFRLPNNSLKNN